MGQRWGCCCSVLRARQLGGQELFGAEVMPLLHQSLETGICGLLERSSRAWQEAPIWLEQLQLRPVALPLCPALAPRQWWQEQGLVAVAEQPTLRERLWLLLPDDLELPQAAQATLSLIRRRVNRAATRESEALLKGGRAAGLVKLVGDGEAT